MGRYVSWARLVVAILAAILVFGSTLGLHIPHGDNQVDWFTMLTGLILLVGADYFLNDKAIARWKAFGEKAKRR